MANIKKIYFDMDGVLADFGRGVEELCHFTYVPNNEKVKEYDEQMWDRIRMVDHFYDKLQPMPGAPEMFKKVSSMYDCEILTGIPKPHHHIENAGEDKIKWVHRILGENVVANVVYKEQKKDFCKGSETILIDDMEKNIEDWREYGGYGIIFKSNEETLRIIQSRSESVE